jgi:hypothetical protein
MHGNLGMWSKSSFGDILRNFPWILNLRTLLLDFWNLNVILGGVLWVFYGNFRQILAGFRDFFRRSFVISEETYDDFLSYRPLEFSQHARFAQKYCFISTNMVALKSQKCVIKMEGTLCQI